MIIWLEAYGAPVRVLLRASSAQSKPSLDLAWSLDPADLLGSGMYFLLLYNLRYCGGRVERKGISHGVLGCIGKGCVAWIDGGILPTAVWAILVTKAREFGFHSPIS